MQLFVIVIFALLAAVVFYNLYAVLGRRIGRQPSDNPQPAPVGAPADRSLPQPDKAAPDVELAGLAAVKSRDPAFDADKFLEGARSAYQMIVRAFAAGDRSTLKGLLAPQVMDRFETAMAARDAEGKSENIEFVHPPRADLETSEVDGDQARIKVRFLGEFTSRAKGPDGAETADERRTAETWTFQRDLSSRDPNWTLVRVDAAEA
ncbi:MAG TPA: TIM44-related membrane protein TimA [Caulobacteraceae bacterium]|nr:TIM44-related membrane protein TimA [Caulobacteraceae bacterium]